MRKFSWDHVILSSFFLIGKLSILPSKTTRKSIIAGRISGKMDGLHTSREERNAAAMATESSQDGPDQLEKLGQGHEQVSVTSSNEDDLDLQKLGYVSVLARGWGSFDNFACSFSALYCIGGIRVLFYIALSAGGPAAMYVSLSLSLRWQ
jgi:hypothetical protein